MKRFLKGIGIFAAASIIMVGCSSDNGKNGEVNDKESTEITESAEKSGKTDEEASKDKGNEDTVSEPKRSIPEVGDDAPEIDITNLEDGSSVGLENLKGKRTLINFFATWCGPCKVEMPDLDKLYENYGEEYNIVAISSGESEEDLKKYKEDMKLNLPIYKDSSDTKTVKNYFVRVVPTSYMLDENGKIEMIVPGVISYEDMEKLIKGE